VAERERPADARDLVRAAELHVEVLRLVGDVDCPAALDVAADLGERPASRDELSDGADRRSPERSVVRVAVGVVAAPAGIAALDALVSRRARVHGVGYRVLFASWMANSAHPVPST
jgi:hypothetical protein